MVGGNAFYTLTQWLVLVVFARVGDATVVGHFTLALAIATPLIMFFNMGMRTLIASDVTQEFSFSQYLGVRLTTVVTGFIAIVFVGALFASDIFPVVVAVAIFKSIESVIDLFYGSAQVDRRMDLVAKSMVIRGSVSIVLLWAIFSLTHRLDLALYAYAASWLTVLVLYDSRHGARLTRVGLTDLRSGLVKVLSHGAPLGVTALFVSLSAAVPRYVLEHTAGAAELGVFSGMTYFILVGTMVVSALGQSLVPVLARLFADGDRSAYLRRLLTAVAFAFSLGVAGAGLSLLIGRQVLDLAYGPEFAAHASLLPLIAVAAAFAYSGNILGYGISSARIFRSQAPAFLVSLVASGAASLYFIPKYGLSGAVFALIVTYVVNCVAPSILLVRSLRGLQQKDLHK